MGRLNSKFFFLTVCLVSFLLGCQGCAAVGQGFSASQKKSALTRIMTQTPSSLVSLRKKSSLGRSSHRPGVKLQHQVSKTVLLGVEGSRKKRFNGIRLPGKLTLGRTYLRTRPENGPGLHLEFGAAAVLKGVKLRGLTVDAATVYQTPWFNSSLNLSVFWWSSNQLAYALTASAVFVI